MCEVAAILARVLESDEEEFAGVEGNEDDVKAVAGFVKPEFRFQVVQTWPNQTAFVYAYDEFIGTVSLDLDVLASQRPWLEPTQAWVVTYAPDKGYVWKRGFKSREEAATAIWMDRIGMKKLREAEDDVDFKEVYYDEYPTFTFIIKGQDIGQPQWGGGAWEISVDGAELGYEPGSKLWIGEIERVLRADNQVVGWRISNVPYPNPPNAQWINEIFSEQIDAARYLWAHRIRSVESKQDRASARRLVGTLIGETEDEEVDFKDFAFDTLASARDALQAAGFKIEQAERVEDVILLKFTWASPTTTAYINGAKRAREAIAPFIPLRHHDWTAERALDDQGQKITRMFIRRRDEEAPWLWKIKRVPNRYDRELEPAAASQTSGTYQILFNDQVVGEIQSPNGHGTAERIRDEMAQLHKILPFTGHGWGSFGNPWGTGRAVEWWRRNRHRLGKTGNDHYLGRDLLGELWQQ